MRTKSTDPAFTSFASLIATVVLALSVGSVTPAAGQETKQQPTQSQPPAPRPATPTLLQSMDEDYRIGVSDVIEIQVVDAPELSVTARVETNGTFLMPYLGRIKAAEKTPEELRNAIADGLRGRYLKNPIVSVVVKQYNSRSFFIQGAVRNPGVYQIEGRAHLLKLVTMAGGLLPNHGATAFIIREIKPSANKNGAVTAPDGVESKPGDSEPQFQFLSVSINGLLSGNFEQNRLIEPGDIINIPITDVFFIAGEVNAPGEFPLKEGTTLRQAISLAQGTTFQATSSRTTIFRGDPVTGKATELKVDLRAVMSGKSEDIQIRANDIIVIPNSKLKSVGGTLLSAFGMGTMQRGRIR
jgi:polysaccharide export outer membrane protein